MVSTCVMDGRRADGENRWIWQVVNYSHLFPTRYALELEGLKGVVGSETFKEVSQREDSKKQIKKLLEDRYTSGKNKWFFQPLRVRLTPYLCVPFSFADVRMRILVLICLGSFPPSTLLCCSQNRYMYITCPRMTHAPITPSCPELYAMGDEILLACLLNWTSCAFSTSLHWCNIMETGPARPSKVRLSSPLTFSRPMVGQIPFSSSSVLRGECSGFLSFFSPCDIV